MEKGKRKTTFSSNKKKPKKGRSSAETEVEQAVKAQTYGVTQPAWLELLCNLSNFPFSTVGELLALSDLTPPLSLNRAQIYLRRAVEWGWVGFVNRYALPIGRSELNPVGATGQGGLLARPGLALSREVELEYLESLAERPAATTPQPSKLARHYYLTPVGAKLLSHLITSRRHNVTIQPASQYNETRLDWQREFVKLFAFEETKVLSYLERLEGLSLARQLLLSLVRATRRGTDNSDDAGEETIRIPTHWWWQEGGSLWFKFTTDTSWTDDLPDLFDAFVVVGNRVWLVVADTERLSPSWLTNYLAKLHFELSSNREGWQRVLLASRPALRMASPCYSYDQSSIEFRLAGAALDKLARRKDLNCLEVVNTAGQLELGLLVITHTRSRAILWREVLARAMIVGQQEDHSIDCQVVPVTQLQEKALSIFLLGNSRPSITSSAVFNDCDAYPGSENWLTSPRTRRLVQYFLRNEASRSSSFPAVSVPLSSASPRSPDPSGSPASLSRPDLNTSRKAAAKLHTVSPAEAEKEYHLGLLEQPSRRKVLFTLHSYPLLDGLACSRLTGIEITHLADHLKQLEKAGLVGRIWGGTARAMRKRRTWKIQSPAESESRTVSGRNRREPLKVSYCSASDVRFSESRAGDVKGVDSSESERRHYQAYGQPRPGLTSRVFQFALEAERLKRYYYFITERGLKTLLWLEGFPLLFESRYRGDLTRFERIRGELARGERQLLLVSCDKQTSSVSRDNPGPEQTSLAPTGMKAIESQVLVGFSWPSLLIEHVSGATGTFMAFPSRHFSLPLSTAPGIYSRPVSPTAASSDLEEGSIRKRSKVQLVECKEIAGRQRLFPGASRVSLESWQTEPTCHRYFLRPVRLAQPGYDLAHSFIPALKTLKREVGGETGECLSDGYGEILVERSSGLKEWVTVYLEYERGKHNWTRRYRGKIRAYLELFWSQWLLASLAARQPLAHLRGVPKYVLLVTTDVREEQHLGLFFKTTLSEVLAELLETAHYAGYGPANCARGNNSVSPQEVEALLTGLNLSFFSTYEHLLNNFGVLSPIWQFI